MLLVFFYFAVASFVSGIDCGVVNIAGATFMSAILLVAAWKHFATSMWTALFWFRVSTVAYFGVGTLFVAAADAFTRSYMEGFFAFYDEDVFKLNLVVCTSVTLVLLAARLTICLLSRHTVSTTLPRGNDSPARAHYLLTTALGFWMVGAFVTYFVKVPAQFGWTDVELAGSLTNLARLSLAGIFLTTLWSLHHAPRWLPLIACGVLTESAFQLLRFSKADALFPIIMFSLGFLWLRPTAFRKVLIPAGLLVLFAALQPIITQAREDLDTHFPDTTRAGFVARAKILTSIVTAEETPTADQRPSVVGRFSYVNAATLVINQYDAGLPGDWPKLIPAVFIPRFLWSEKPIITDIGRDIYELGTGRRTSQAGAGLFADAYWAMGWVGIAVLMPIVGALLAVLSLISAQILNSRRWFYFPIVLMAMHIGFRVDGHYIADVAGASVILGGTLCLLYGVATAAKAMQRSVHKA